MRPVTPNDIFILINSLKNTQSTGYDVITTLSIKHEAHYYLSSTKPYY